MPLPTTSIDPSQGMVKVDSTQISPGSQPVLSSGDVLRVTIRRPGSEGQGLIFLNGQLVQASVPDNLKAGDRVLAQLNVSAQELNLKVLSLLTAIPDQGSQSFLGSTPANPIAQLLQKLVRNTGGTLIPNLQLPGATPAEGEAPTATNARAVLGDGIFNALSKMTRAGQTVVTEEGSVTKQVPTPAAEKVWAAIDHLLPALAQAPSAGTGPAFTQAIKKSISAEVAPLLRDLGVALRDAFPVTEESFTEHFLGEVQQTLRKLVADMPENVRTLRLRDTLEVLNEELPKVRGKEREVLKKLAEHLAASAGDDTKMTGVLKESLGHIDTLLQQLPKPSYSYAEALRAREFAAQLDQLAATYETLSQLSPLMEALGEPAFILLPTLFQGLFSNAQLSAERVQDPFKKVHNDDESGGKKREENSEYSVQLLVPLPNLGEIQVTIRHRSDVSVELVANDENVAGFLKGELPQLVEVLEKAGFKPGAMSSKVGQVTSAAPDWVNTLRSGTSVIA